MIYYLLIFIGYTGIAASMRLIQRKKGFTGGMHGSSYVKGVSAQISGVVQICLLIVAILFALINIIKKYGITNQSILFLFVTICLGLILDRYFDKKIVAALKKKDPRDAFSGSYVITKVDWAIMLIILASFVTAYLGW